MSARIAVACGSGGVGKTTTSAALALSLAARGQRVAVLTIDPARRLADAMGVTGLGNEPIRVPIERVLPEGAPAGRLDAIMLDMKATFDDVVRRYAPSDEIKRVILGNHYYRFVSSRLAGTHEYMAMEKLLELHDSGAYDVIVLDTPPARHALEFLEAPERLQGLFDEGVMSWISLPRNNVGFRMLERGSVALMGVLRRFLGDRTISDIAAFFHAFNTLWGGFRERSGEVRALLSSDACVFFLVTSPAPAARAEAQEFLEVLSADHIPFGGFLVNRMLDAPASGAPLDAAAFPPRPDSVPEAAGAQIVEAVRRAPAEHARLAALDADAVASLREASPDTPLWPIPELICDVNSLEGILAVAGYLSAPTDRVLGG